MKKYIYDESNGLWYELNGDYYLPCITLPTEKKHPIGLFGQKHLQHLKQNRHGTYMSLLISGKLNSYLVAIDRQAHDRLDIIIEQMKEAQGITEQLKIDNAMEWVSKMNSIKACAMEIVDKEIIYN